MTIEMLSRIRNGAAFNVKFCKDVNINYGEIS